MMAALMAANALAIDAMLPALPAIGEALDVAEPNRRQLVITFYLLGFGVAQLIYGPLADRFGRKWLLFMSLGLYALFGALAGLAGSFTMLLAARMLQGAAAAASRVLVMAVVRDLYRGPAMAQLMSLIMIVFMIVPVLAPAFGQGVMAIASWRHIFIGLAVYGLTLMVWAGLRLPETLDPANRRPLSPTAVASAARQALGNRAFAGNTLVTTLLMGSLFAFINSIQQIVDDVFGVPGLIGLVFAAIALPMALSSYANTRLVMRFGPRRLLLSALAGFTAISALHLLFVLGAGEVLASFVLFQAATMATFGLIGANAGALSMEPMGRIAGTASSLQGLITTVGGALIGLGIGQAFNGSTAPMVAGFALCGGAALLTAHWANRPPAETA